MDQQFRRFLPRQFADWPGTYTIEGTATAPCPLAGQGMTGAAPGTTAEAVTAGRGTGLASGVAIRSTPTQIPEATRIATTARGALT